MSHGGCCVSFGANASHEMRLCILNYFHRCLTWFAEERVMGELGPLLLREQLQPQLIGDDNSIRVKMRRCV